MTILMILFILVILDFQFVKKYSFQEELNVE